MSKLIFEKKSANVGGYLPETPEGFDPSRLVPPELLRQSGIPLPEVAEPEVARHYTNLSRKNFSVDTHFYPLGSCTMKYNPKVNNAVSAWPSFARLHPYQGDERSQGALEIFYELEKALCEITGMDAFSLQPAAGAHGELTGLFVVRAYHASRKDKRFKVLVPDSAHGTNPATAALSGCEVVEVRSGPNGRVDLEDYRAKMDSSCACFMITNPNTLGLFETDVAAICALAHEKGALVYYDGANLNALLGIARPGDMGFDVAHVNLHKTFAVPHGSGGPGAGPLGVKKHLEPFLPSPRIKKDRRKLSWDYTCPQSIGRVRSFYGNFGALLRAYAYIKIMGGPGLLNASKDAILNANYLRQKLSGSYDVPYAARPMHEFVISASRQKARGVRALDIAKKLLDFGIHAPTIYFPHIVEEAMMIEPTETESLETLDRFAEVMIEIDRLSRENPASVTNAPQTTPVKRIDEVLAARQPDLRWKA